MVVYSLSEILQGKEDQLAKGAKLEREIKSLDLKLYGELQSEEARELNARFVYHTNAIECSKLSFENTLRAGAFYHSLLFDIKIGAAPKMKRDTEGFDICEAITLSKVISAGLESQKPNLDLNNICKIHEDIFYSTANHAGIIRKSGELVIVKGSGGAVYSRGAELENIVPLLNELEQWYSNSAQYGCLVQAAVVHNQLLHIHPFKDGNGRVSRVFLAQIMNAGGLPIPIVRVEHKLPYYAAIQEYQQDHNIEPMLNFLLACAYLNKAEQVFNPLIKRGLRTIE